MKNVIFSFVSILSLLSLTAQQGVIKGRVVDSQSEIPLIGANVILENSDPVVGGVTDLDGYFRIESVPVGRQSIAIDNILQVEPYLGQRLKLKMRTYGDKVEMLVSRQRAAEFKDWLDS